MAFLGGKHVMLSYNWQSSQQLVSEVCKILKAENIPVWFDIQGDMKDDIYDSMSDGVENAAIVCCFITPKYQESTNCKLELKYAQTRGKRILPCKFSKEKDWKPSGWLGLITAGINYVNYKDDSDEHIQLKTKELIARIKEQPPAKEPSSEPSYLIELIKYEYTRVQNARIARLMDPAKSFPIEQSYVNLSIVNDKEQREKEKRLANTQHNDAVIGTFEEIYGTKTAIDVKDIFEACKTSEKQILVFGRAGIGKSTFCRYITYQWATGSYWSQYDILALIPFRRLTADRYPSGRDYSLIDIVKKEIFHRDLSEKDKKLFDKQFNAKNTLWILDGYDEMVQNPPSHLERLFETLLKTPHHILTSRSYNIALSYDVQMEITGFTDENIEQFTLKFFDQMKDELDDASIRSQNLLNFSKSNPSIWGIAHIPVNLELICSLWSNVGSFEATEVTITNLYTKMTEWLCRRYLKGPNNQIQQLSESEVNQRCQSELTFLDTLAFNAMKNNSIILRPSLLKATLKEINMSLSDHPHILNIGILKAFNKQGVGDQIQLNKDHYFVHLSFQEYFAARYLTNAINDIPSPEVIEFISSNKYNQRFTLLFTFAAGILAETNFNTKLNIFWDIILGKPTDLAGIRHTQLIISCLGEIKKNSAFSRRAELSDNIIRWMESVVFSRHYAIREHIITSLAQSPLLLCEQNFIDSLIKLLELDHSKIKIMTCQIISRLPTSNEQSELLQPLCKLLHDENEDVRRNACFTLGNIAEKAGTSEVIRKLVTALEHENEGVRKNACEALGNIGEKAGTSEVISKLVTALEDENDDVRKNACEALGNIAEKAGTSEVISKLVTALEDESWSVRRSACFALGNIAEKAGTSEVISKLVKALEHENEGVRQNACFALAKIGEKAGTSEVISKLVTALEDENDDVRRSTCEALGNIAEKAGTSEVISKLVTVLEDESWSVRQSACEALGKIGEKAGTSEVISKLLTALEHENEDVRRNACFALGEIGENAGTSEVISKLVTALEDENEDVRYRACEALGKIGAKAGTSEVISKLVTALEHENEDVRRNACFALGKIGEKAGTSEVISKLVTALEDENAYVRYRACEALGNIGEKAGTSEVISQLVTALEDENEDVRQNAYEALGKIGAKAGTSEVISKLVTALEHENEDVRRNACFALGKIGEKAGTSEVISKLVTALEDENAYVRYRACEALGNIGEKAGTSEVISQLVTALEDENEDVRQNAYEALGKIGEKAGTSEVISKLVTALEHENERVRQNAYEALGKIGEKAGTSEVISKLVTALEDENDDVRQNACEALGKIGEKAGTNKIIKRLLERFPDESYWVKGAIKETLEMMLSSLSVMIELRSDAVAQLYNFIETDDWVEEWTISSDNFIKMFLNTSDDTWLRVATLVTILQGNAVIVTQSSVIVYGRREPVELRIDKKNLHDQLVQAFVVQTKKLGVPSNLWLKVSEEPTKGERKRKERSSMCSVL